jgi:predicted transcriptional regulator
VIDFITMDQISEQEVKVYLFIKDHPYWLSIKEIRGKLRDVARVTINHHLRQFVARGMAEKIHVFPGDRYKFLPDTGEAAYRERLDAAAQAFRQPLSAAPA